MPVPGFLASFADKAQNAINASPLAAHIPASLQHRASSPDPATQPTANEAAAQGGARSYALENIQYQFRSLQQQYSSTTPVQKIITVEKGVALDYDSVSRNAKSQSKELYTWGQTEPEDLKDVTDRLAYLNFVQGSLASSLSAKLESARAPLKALRDAETNLQPRRNIRVGLQTQIGRVEHEQQKGNEKRIADLREQLRKAELEDQQLEREVEILKRKAVRESEQIKWDAIREYGEKLVLLSQAASPIIAALPSVPPTPTSPYTGAQTTGAVRASLQRALDNYKTGHINLPAQVGAVDLSRSDTRSFGESHASELSSIHSTPTNAASQTPPLSASKPLPVSSTHPISTHVAGSPPINPQALNQMPTPIHLSPASVPPPVGPGISSTFSGSNNSPPSFPEIIPTVAETGLPVTAGPGGPGPASGSLHDIKGAADSAGPRTGGFPSSPPQAQGYGQPQPGSGFAYPSAEDEKRRLAASYSQRAPVAPSTSQPPPHHESAEEEKKRLERQERDRLLHQGGQGPNVPPKHDKHDDEDLPAYQEPGQ